MTRGMGRVRRRDALLAAGAAGTGAAAGVAGTFGAQALADDSGPLPFYGGTASLLPAPDPDTPIATDLRLVWRAHTSARALALTFDDGPHPEWTPKVLAALAAADAPATFFLRGDNVTAHGAVHRDSVGRHELGNHTYTHTDLGRLDLAAARSEIERCSAAMDAAYGIRPTLFRPPYGHASGASLLAAAEAGLTTVLWSGRFRESSFRDHPDGVVADAAGQMRPGTIFLGHDSGTADRILSIDRLPALLTRLRGDGWTFHTVSSLLALAGTAHA